MKKFLLYAILAVLLSSNHALAFQNDYVTNEASKTSFPLASEGKVASLLVSSKDYKGVLRVANHLQNDLKKVTGVQPKLLKDNADGEKLLIIIGTLGKNDLIDHLAKVNKIDAKELSGKWEKFMIQIVKNPLPNVKRALVIAGSDKRGTIYGMYDLSEQIGVSPWHFWADVPVQKHSELHVEDGIFTDGEPKVKYRGIFLNDEAPALRGWATETYGGFNHQFYETVYELILRNKGNYLWPAMWQPSAFAADDPESPRLADEYGIVIATTHHEPMMRAHDEWDRVNGGDWNYATNKEKLQEFWRGGVERMGDYESVVTVGMRGHGDEAMTEETVVDLLQNIITDQRKIIAEVTEKPAEETPQVWAIYKEVQDYYDKGMRVADDIMILFCDDNWGNVRILPKKEDRNYKGGFGMYYHFDFVGGPVSYRWHNVTQIEKVWEQMRLTYSWGIKDLWLVNVGDLKPMELPISFFLDLAWNAESIKAEDLPNYYVNWATQQFGGKHAEEIAEILALYTKYNARRTPEMLKPDTYSISNYREADRILEEYQALLEKAKRIYEELPKTHKAAFYQLVLSPVGLCSNLNEMYVAAGKNELYAEQGRASANFYGDKVKELFFKDAELTREFHEDLANGKWNHMMAQTHIGYTNWNNPPVNKMPSVSYIHLQKPASLGYVIEHGKSRRGIERGLYANSFPTFDPINDQKYFVEIFNRGMEQLSYSIKTENDWIKLSSDQGTIQYDEKVYVSIDWEKVPEETTEGEIIISGSRRPYTVKIPIWNDLPKASGFIENNGVVSIEAAEYTQKHNATGIQWTVIPNMGRTHSAVTVEPMNANRQTPNTDTPYLEYEFTIFKDADLKVNTYLSPTLNYQKSEGLKFAIAIDEESPKIINLHEGETQPDWEYPEWWNNSVTDHIKIKQSEHPKIKAGTHTLKVWMVDPGVVFQKFVIDAGGMKASYLGAEKSINLER